jgi:hypothetical protein
MIIIAGGIILVFGIILLIRAVFPALADGFRARQQAIN